MTHTCLIVAYAWFNSPFVIITCLLLTYTGLLLWHIPGHTQSLPKYFVFWWHTLFCYCGVLLVKLTFNHYLLTFGEIRWSVIVTYSWSYSLFAIIICLFGVINSLLLWHNPAHTHSLSLSFVFWGHTLVLCCGFFLVIFNVCHNYLSFGDIR